MWYTKSSIKVLFITLLLANEYVNVFAQNTSPISEVKSNEVHHSTLQRLYVKQKTGFDGKVRAIRFNIEPENIHFLENPDEKILATDKSESKFSSADDQDTNDNNEKHKMITTPKTSGGRRLLQSNEKRRSSNVTKFMPDSSLIAVESIKTKRSIDNKSLNSELNDLQTDEAKVFRPLFVYRQQVAKRLRKQNDKKAGAGGSGPKIQQPKPVPNNYYYHQAPYYYQRYLYDPYNRIIF